MAMTKTEFLNEMANRTEMTKKQVDLFLDKMAGFAKQTLKKEGTIKIPGLVQLDLKDRAARMGHNPATGEKIMIPAKRVLKARVVKALKDEVL